MTGEEYKDLAMRTYDGKAGERLKEAMQDIKDPGGLLNGCLGLSGETGEVVDAIKKVLFHGKERNDQEIKKELGDVLWYVALIAESLGYSMDEIMEQNIDKLKKRYPEGFRTVKEREQEGQEDNA
jgi:NTP pyrophosphatase (non-canonical NTP hydrolase)